MMRLVRVFPRKTTATPDDELSIVNRAPNLFDAADEVHISVAYTWDIPRAEELEKQWRQVAPVKIGGPAYDDHGGEFEPGMYLRKGYVITSRGCNNRCWFCSAWKREGTIRELHIHDGWNIQDNNILACSREHRSRVYEMLKRQPERPRFTGGLEAKLLTDWDAEQMATLKPRSAYFAYDTPDDYDPLVTASQILKRHGLMKNNVMGCYVLVGYKNDTMEKAEKRLSETMRLGYMPQAMLFNRDEDRAKNVEWIKFARSWANKIIVGSRMKNQEGMR